MKLINLIAILMFVSNVNINATNFQYLKNHCEIKRPNWKRIDNYRNTRTEILIRDCEKLIINSKNKVNTDLTMCKDAYNKKTYKAKQLQVEHILPWSFIVKNSKNCIGILEKYNDKANLVLVNAKDNRLKSDRVGKIREFSIETNKLICEKQIYICNKMQLANCKSIKNLCY